MRSGKTIPFVKARTVMFKACLMWMLTLSSYACQGRVTPTVTVTPTIAVDFIATATPVSALASPTITPSPAASPSILAAPALLPSPAQLIAELPLLNDFGGRVRRFDWAPTGEALAFIAPDEELAPFAGALMLIAAPAFNRPQPLALNAIRDVTWSPEGAQVAFVGWRANDELETVSIVNVDGANPRDLFPGAAAQTDPGIGAKTLEGWWDPQWLLVGVNCGAGARCLRRFDLVQRTEAMLFPEGPVGISDYAWSPDRAAFVATAGFNPQIGFLASREEDLLQRPGLDGLLWRSGVGVSDAAWTDFWTFFADWSPDSERVLFLRQDMGGTALPELWVWEIATTEASALLPGVIAARWSPDGARIAFLTWGSPQVTPSGIWRGVELAPSGQNSLGVGLYSWSAGEIITFFDVGLIQFDLHNLRDAPLLLSWSSDGSQLVYGLGADRVGILAGDGAWRYELPLPGRASGALACWSPDGRWLALSAMDTLWVFAVPSALR